MLKGRFNECVGYGRYSDKSPCSNETDSRHKIYVDCINKQNVIAYSITLIVSRIGSFYLDNPDLFEGNTITAITKWNRDYKVLNCGDTTELRLCKIKTLRTLEQEILKANLIGLGTGGIISLFGIAATILYLKRQMREGEQILTNDSDLVNQLALSENDLVPENFHNLLEELKDKILSYLSEENMFFSALNKNQRMAFRQLGREEYNLVFWEIKIAYEKKLEKYIVLSSTRIFKEYASLGLKITIPMAGIGFSQGFVIALFQEAIMVLLEALITDKIWLNAIITDKKWLNMVGAAGVTSSVALQLGLLLLMNKKSKSFSNNLSTCLKEANTMRQFHGHEIGLFAPKEIVHTIEIVETENQCQRLLDRSPSLYTV